MSQVRKLATAAGTFSVALGIGFVMQNGDALAARMNGPEVRPAEEAVDLPELPDGSTASFLPVAVGNTISHDPMDTNVVLPSEVVAPVVPDMQLVANAIAIVNRDPTPIEAVAVDPGLASEPTAPVVAPAVAAVAGTCAPTLSGTVAPAASVMLTYTASCSPNAVVTIHHQGMMFDILTDASGQAQVTVPAFSETAVFMADLSGGQGAVTTVSVPDVAQFDRAVLQTNGDAAIMLHAREFGARTGDEGHVWQAAARAADAALDGSGGFLVEMGDTSIAGARTAQVYTYPSGLSSAQGAVALSIEAEVTADNCGQGFVAQTLQFTPGADPVALDLEVTLPPCNVVGTFLVLNNLLTDLTLASR